YAAAPVFVGGQRFRRMLERRRDVVGEHGAADAGLNVLITPVGFVDAEEELIRGPGDLDRIVTVVQVVVVGVRGMVRLRPKGQVVGKQLALAWNAAAVCGWKPVA